MVCSQQDSNLRPSHYKCDALPTKLCERLFKIKINLNLNLKIFIDYKMPLFFHLICRNCERDVILDTYDIVEKTKSKICPRCLIGLEKAHVRPCDDNCNLCSKGTN